MNSVMENIALSDSNDDLVDEIIDDHHSFRPPVAQHDEHQKVASELQDAANTDVTKRRIDLFKIPSPHYYFFFFSGLFSKFNNSI